MDSDICFSPPGKGKVYFPLTIEQDDMLKPAPDKGLCHQQDKQGGRFVPNIEHTAKQIKNDTCQYQRQYFLSIQFFQGAVVTGDDGNQAGQKVKHGHTPSD